MGEIYYIIAFDSTNHAISTEKLFKDEGKEFMMIPTPREITSSCGLSLRFQKGDLLFAQDVLQERKISYYGIFKVQLEQGRKSIEKL